MLTVDSTCIMLTCKHMHVYTFARLRRSIAQATHVMKDVFEQRTPARQKLPTESKFWLTVFKFVSHQGLSCCYARPCVNVFPPLVTLVQDESSYEVWGIASLTNVPCWAPDIEINDLIFSLFFFCSLLLRSVTSLTLSLKFVSHPDFFNFPAKKKGMICS